MNMKKQFVGDAMWVTLSLIGIMHALAFFVRDTQLEIVLLICFGLLTVFLAWKSMLHGLLIAFAEIFVGGHGHLLDVDVFGFSLSLRMLIFGIVMVIWFIKYLWRARRTEELIDFKLNAVRDVPWMIIILAVALGTFIGFVQNNPGSAFDDMNGYVSIGYLLPMLTLVWSHENKRVLLQVLFASMIWIIGFTAILGYAFTHINGDILHNLYTFVRDARLVEVTLQVIDNKGGLLDLILVKFGLANAGDYWYRIFMPAQTVVMFGLLLMYAAMTYLWRKSKAPALVWIIFGMSTMTLFFSLSRSFILGATAGALMIFVSAWFFGKGKRWILGRTIGAFVVAALAMSAIWGIVHVPIPARPDLTDAAFFETSAQTGRTEAVVSRWNLLDALMDELTVNPILGSGFGEEVTYNSQDPRIISEQGGDVYSTYRLEWGWHDIWLKMGLLGLVGFGWYFVSLLRVGWLTARSKGHAWLVIGLMAGMIALFVTHIFSPYLNHPIGIGFMLFVLPFIDWDRFGKKQVVVKVVGQKKLIKQSVPIMTSHVK